MKLLILLVIINGLYRNVSLQENTTLITDSIFQDTVSLPTFEDLKKHLHKCKTSESPNEVIPSLKGVGQLQNHDIFETQRMNQISPEAYFHLYEAGTSRTPFLVSDDDSTDPGPNVDKEKKQMLRSRRRQTVLCEQCGKIFNYYNNLVVHIRRIHEGKRPFPCDHCEKCFKTKQSLVRHNYVHSGEKPYPCNICGQRFGHPGSRRQHSMAKHGPNYEIKRSFSCVICGKSFKKSQVLSNHMSTHTHERPFECKTCGKSFKRKDYLKVHSRIHITEKPFLGTSYTESLNRGRDLRQPGSCYERNHYVMSQSQLKDTGNKRVNYDQV
ncbi:hypothetical protein QAD02_005946 [Eretmocerus hayati]|uniref:Uncharacterized protein n=1 Tax=Eretmocerus hayati TaxID=131215 RepID=A0ACC2MZQ2_9HYME|nr:hypothetical protein QAD02_005946 [Eretmocerus hayati]